MLERLAITNLALVERAEIVFGAGLNVVTGETGAGKSLLVQSMELLLGGRADAAHVREGAEAATVEGELRLEGPSAERVGALLESWGAPLDGDTLILRREVQAGGRSRAHVNQASVTIASLRQLGERLADLHGQHEHQSLLRADAGLETLESLGDSAPARARYAETYETWRAAAGALERLERMLREHDARREEMADAARELDEAALREGEEESLAGEAARLAHADRLRELVTQALGRLSEGEAPAVEGLDAAAHAVERAAELDPSLDEHVRALEEARIAAAEAARGLAAYLETLDADPGALEAVEARRALIARLTRKHRRPVPELLSWREELRAALEAGEDAEGTRARAAAAAASAEGAAWAAGRALSKARQAAAVEWSKRLTRELRSLGMPHARFAFEVSPLGEDGAALAPTGLDRVEMLFSANPDVSLRPLQRIVSGGELSRVMLGLKAALEAQDRVDLLVFDEVDSGIGGAVAQAVGERLQKLARHRQIVCVTHLPMIAALAQHHLRVEKRVTQGRTNVRFERLRGRERVDELARMLAGQRATDTTRRQARELLAAAGEAP